MPLYQYAKAGGGLGTINAPDPNSAQKMLPPDADPHSGVQEMPSGTGTVTPNPPPTGTQPAPALPTGAPSTPSLPAGGKSSPILDFASALEQAVNLARSKRNASSVDMMAPYKGTVAASDFNGVLNNLNTASDKTSSDLIKQATDLSKSDIITATSDDGTVHGIDKNTGKVIWSTPGVGNKQGGGGTADTLVKSGGLTYTRTDYSDDASALEASRGVGTGDNYVDPNLYKNLYDAWVAKGGKIADFVKTFPPADYVNPANTFLPAYLRPKAVASNPFAQ